MSAIMKHILAPELFYKLKLYDAYLVGSQAEIWALEKRLYLNRDWDVVVPWAQWHRAKFVVPRDATLNGYRGYRFTNDGQEFDLWPDDLPRVLMQGIKDRKKTMYAVHLKTSIVFRAEA